MESLKHRNKVVGIKETKNAIKAGAADVVYIAEDVDFYAVQPLRELCAEMGVRLEAVPARKELAKACGINVPTAAAAVLKD